MESEIQLPSLGRSVKVGMPYDCRKDKLVMRSIIRNHRSNEAEEILQGHYTAEIHSEDNMKRKSENLGISGDVKLSVLGGLIGIGGGAAKYIADQISSEKQARVTLKYSCTTHVTSITLEQISSLDHSQLVDSEATHLVTGVSYGIQAFMIFDQKCSSIEEKCKVQGKLEASVKAIKEFAPSGSVNGDRSSSNSTQMNSVSCQYYGDVALSSIPLTYEGAIDAYKELTKMGKEKSVPQIIYLTPLHCIDHNQYQPISIHPVATAITMKIEAILDYFHKCEIKCKDLEDLEACTVFTSVHDQISRFQKLLHHYRIDLKRKVSDLVPQVRSTGKKKDLTDFIESIRNSPFSEERCREFIEDKRIELTILNQHRKNFKLLDKPKVVHAFSNEPWLVDQLIHDSNYEKVICFVFNITSESNNYLDAMESYLDSGESPSLDITQWSRNEKTKSTLVAESSKFSQFIENNKENPRFAFVVCERRTEVESNGPVCVCYSNAEHKVFKMPPAPVITGVNSEMFGIITFSWGMPRESDYDIQLYLIHYRRSHHTKWYTESVQNQHGYTIQNVHPNTEYCIAVQAHTQYGLSPRSSEKRVTTAPVSKQLMYETFLLYYFKFSHLRMSQRLS